MIVAAGSSSSNSNCSNSSSNCSKRGCLLFSLFLLDSLLTTFWKGRRARKIRTQPCRPLHTRQEQQQQQQQQVQQQQQQQHQALK
ncbi:hypothetical protein Emed_002013 [Eimeria media]